MYRKTLFSALLVSAGIFGAPARADGCADALKALRATYTAGSVDEILGAVRDLRAGGGCNTATVTRATSQASGVLANRAGREVAQGNLAGAEAILARAPGLHWAVQAVRGDIAAALGERAEAAQLYNAALDTITDPALTPPDSKLVPVAERLARLAQENMMLAGTLEGTVTRGGSPSGVLKSAVRGITIEAVGESDGEETLAETTPVDTGQDEAPGTDAGHEEAPIREAGHDEAPATHDPGKAEDTKDTGFDVADRKAAHDVLYPGGKEEDYALADAAAKSTTAVFLPIKFATNADYLDDKARYEAEYIGAFLKANGITEITLIGHTDERGPDSYNLDLSYRRAQSVRDYLMHYLAQYDAYAYIHVDGKGERHPPHLSDPHLYSTEERQAIARRVELVLHK